MRKLFAFWSLCTCYLSFYILIPILILFYIILGFFIFIFGEDIINEYNFFVGKVSRLVDNKIKIVKENEKYILNKQIIESGESGKKLKNVTWNKEIYETLFIILAMMLFINLQLFMNNH